MVTADESANQELNTDLQFISVNEMSRKLFTADEESNYNQSNDTKYIGFKSEVPDKLRLPVKPTQSATVNEAESATKEPLKETITISVDVIKNDVENKPTTVELENEEPQNKNDGDSSQRCNPLFHSPIKSSQCDKGNGNNTKEVASSETEVNGTLQGVDAVRGRKLKQRMLELLEDEYKVLSVINKGLYNL